MKLIASLFTLLLISVSAQADCDTEQMWCETSCRVQHVGDDAARVGCLSRCVAERAVCSTKAGADYAVELGREAIDGAKQNDQNAGCDVQQNWCETGCDSRYLTDDAARNGCRSRCVAERAACSTKAGAGKAVELGKDAWDGTKSFFKGLTE